MTSGRSLRFVVAATDPDLPLPFEVYAAVASAARHHDGVEVWVDARHTDLWVPYGMWWDETRRIASVHRGRPAEGGLAPEGIWLGPAEVVADDDPRAADLLDELHGPAWLEAV